MKRLGAPPYTCLITPGDANSLNFASEKARILETIREASADRVSIVQIREKSLPARLLFELSAAAARSLATASTLLVVNGRPDVAAASGADGVHLPGNSIPTKVVRRAFGPELVIGVSTHSIREAEAAASSGADYIFFGPIFDTPGKGAPTGLGALATVATRLRTFPVIALGGIDRDNFIDAMNAGASGIAAIRSLNETGIRRSICSALIERV